MGGWGGEPPETPREDPSTVSCCRRHNIAIQALSKSAILSDCLDSRGGIKIMRTRHVTLCHNTLFYFPERLETARARTHIYIYTHKQWGCYSIRRDLACRPTMLQLLFFLFTFPQTNHPVKCCDSNNPYPTAFPYGNGMVLHFYQQQESSTTKTVHKVINKGLKTYV